MRDRIELEEVFEADAQAREKKLAILGNCDTLNPVSERNNNTKNIMNINTPETDAYECAMAEDPGNYFGEDSTREAYEFARKLERRLIMRDKEYIHFLNVTFKVEKNPNYTGNHCLAKTNSITGNTYPLGTTEQEMIEQFYSRHVNKATTYGDIVRVIKVKCFEDKSPKGRFHKDNY